LAENFPFLSLPDKKAKEDAGCLNFLLHWNLKYGARHVCKKQIFFLV
jgi:hypothetical protein